MIDVLAVLMHWYASCVSSGHVIPGAAGMVAGAAGAVGGAGGLSFDAPSPIPKEGPFGLPYYPLGPRTPEENLEALGLLTGAGEIAAALEAGEEVADVVQRYAANKLVEEGLKTASEAVGEAFDQAMEAEPPAEPEQVMYGWLLFRGPFERDFASHRRAQ